MDPNEPKSTEGVPAVDRYASTQHIADELRRQLEESGESMSHLLDGTQHWPMDGSGQVWIGELSANPFDEDGNSPMIGGDSGS